MKKVSIIFLVFLLALSSTLFSPIPSEASSSPTRLSGDNRLGTALHVSKTGWSAGLTTTEKSVVIARADDPADALAAASLAGVKDSPILLTYPEKLDNSVLNELNRLGAKKVYLLGGTAAISSNVDKTLKSKGYSVQRVAGAGRYQTASKINEVAGTSKGTKAILANGQTVADALSASATSSINEIPIYLSTKNELQVALPSNIKQVDIYGGTAVISEAVENKLKSKGITVRRISGSNRYATSVAAANQLNISSDKIILVRGESVKADKQDYPDAVAASGLANKLNAKVLLVHPSKGNSSSKSYLNGKNLNTYVLGGKSAVSNRALSDLGYDTPSDLLVHFIDVGQGDSTLIETQGKTVLIDGGKRTAGDKVVAYLKKAGITSIDYLVATHPDADHIGGLIDVLNQIKVGRVLDSGITHTSQTYLDYLKLIDSKNISFEVPTVGKVFTIDTGINLKVLNNGKGYSDNNEGSIVTKLSYDNVSFMLTGDATTKSESIMMERFNLSDIRSTFLKVGHHGSSSSTSQAFLNEVNPKVGILSYGDNSYGHPTSEIVSRLRNKNVALYSTHDSGDIVVDTDGSSYTINASPFTGGGEKEPPSDPTGKIDITGLDLSEEIVTLKNIDSKDIPMDGWKLVSTVGNQTFKFPSNFVLKKGKSVKIVAGRGAVNNPPSQLLWSNAYIWNNSGDSAVLYDPQGKKIDQLAK
ncbi:cell wall-binding repeat-containing protein [Rossellomorea vietnamensis]|uniref:cell wall-binding repeat-containing protein n=1 Tax=Rossellomorea vietnamensis TaxID=218284 RepID=UPI003CEC2214